MLEASIALEEVPSLARRAAAARRRPSPPGWAWLRPFRRFDEYERALAELDRDQSLSPGRMNWSSGTMQLRDVRSR